MPQTKPFHRATLSPDLVPLREKALRLLPTLEAKPGWYASVSVQKLSTRSYNVNSRGSRVSDQFTTGLVLRIFDGYTMHEQATDRLEWDHVEELARKFAQTTLSFKAPVGVPARPYTPPTWSERLKLKLEDEIRSQIPAGVSAATPVHFGIRFEEDPRALSTEDWFARGRRLFDEIHACAPDAEFPIEEINLAEARQSFAIDESLFIDRESNLSQTLYRSVTTAIALSGEDNVWIRPGGLGGLECMKAERSEIVDMLKNLKALKSAERLVPGKYRVLFSPGLSGVLAHEAFGHSQEGDTCARGRSKAWDLYQSGELVGNPQATILNNPAIYENGANGFAAWGSYFFDAEGWLAQEQVILDQGRLNPPMTNFTSAVRLGVPRTANGRRQDWSHGIYTRQTNTYFSAGDSTYDQLVAQMKDGFIATECAGGMEDPKGMNIQVGIAYLKEVKDGKLTGRLFRGPARGDIQMTGYTPDVLHAIIGKSKIEHDKASPDRARHPLNDVGGCGKYHKEYVAVGCGGPWMLLDQIILG